MGKLFYFDLPIILRGMHRTLALWLYAAAIASAGTLPVITSSNTGISKNFVWDAEFTSPNAPWQNGTSAFAMTITGDALASVPTDAYIQYDLLRGFAFDANSPDYYPVSAPSKAAMIAAQTGEALLTSSTLLASISAFPQSLVSQSLTVPAVPLYLPSFSVSMMDDADVPEPSSLVLMGTVLVIGVLLWRRKGYPRVS